MTKFFLWVLLTLSFIWLRSSYGKLTGGTFVQNLGKTLEKFASDNPYPLFKGFLQDAAIPNSVIFGNLTMYGEVFAGAIILIVALYYLTNQKNSRVLNFLLFLGLLVGAFLNGIFWLAAGWTSPSTDGLNLLMFVIQVIGIIYLTKDKKLAVR